MKKFLIVTTCTVGIKYQAHIRHIDGTIITVIWDNNKERFYESIKEWELENQDDNLSVEIV